MEPRDGNEDEVYKLVLRKLKALTVDGTFNSADTLAYYEYAWDETKDLKENLPRALNEHGVLAYLIKAGVVDGDQGENVYRKQQLSGEVSWPDWDQAPVSMREFEQETVIYTINVNKFEEQLTKLGLEDRGMTLASDTSILRLPQVTVTIGDFAIHTGNFISFKGKEIRLEPQEMRIAAHIMEKSTRDIYTTHEDIMNDILSEQYIEKAKTSGNIKQRVIDSVSSIRTAFKNATQTDKDHFPNRRTVGYIFKQ